MDSIKAAKKQPRKRVVDEVSSAISSSSQKKRKHRENNTTVSTWSKSKKKRLRKLLGKQKHAVDSTPIATVSTIQQAAKLKPSLNEKTNVSEKQIPMKQGIPLPKYTKPFDSGIKIIGKTSTLQQAFMERLSGSRFRILNEELYNHSSTESFHRFTTNPILFDEYHQGFRQQVQSWPENPVDWIFNFIIVHQRKTQSPPLVVADFGCGEAALAEKLLKESHKQKKKTTSSASNSCPSIVIHSLDLVSNGNPLITACDMANTPLNTASIDIGVFCLSLMGINVADFIREAYRVLKPTGILKIVEVRSRFEQGSNNIKTKHHDQSILDQFVESMQQLGFRCTSKNQTNVMFVLLDFIKMENQIPDPHLVVNLKPCIYKRR